MLYNCRVTDGSRQSGDILGVMTSGDRRVLIADAALDLLGRAGARGLTHRAIDAELGLPPGSTSFYFRTRNALVLAAAERLVEQDLVVAAESMTGRAGSPEQVAAGLADLVSRYSKGALKRHAIARFEIFLIATRDPDIARVIERYKAAFADLSQAVTPDVSPEEALTGATAAIALVEGLILSNLRMPGSPQRRAELEEIFLALLRSDRGVMG